MRQLRRAEISQRGCEYCKHKRNEIIKSGSWYKKKSHVCPFEACPYQELDGHASYIDYLEANEMNFNYSHKERGMSSESEMLFGTNQNNGCQNQFRH